MFIQQLGNKNFTLLKTMLNMHSTKNKTIAENIANVNTPHYRKKAFLFADSLQQAMSKGTAEAYHNVQGSFEHPKNTLARHNGNNVDIEQEMLDLSENQKLYQLYTEIYNKKTEMVQLAIRGGR